MRPKLKFYDLAALHADGFCENVTGDISAAAWTTIAGSPADGCSHQTTLASTANLSGITITVNGTDAEDRVLTEDIAGPNNNTVTLTAYFKTVTSVSAGATLGANTMNVGWTALCYTPTYPTRVYSHGSPNMSVNLGGTTVNYTMQETNDNIYVNNPAQWHNIPDRDNIAVGTVGEAADGTSGLRISVNSHTTGELYITYSQPRS